MLSSSTMKRASASYSTTRRCHMRLQMMSALSCSTTNNVGRSCHVRLQMTSALSELTISSRDVVMVDAMLSFPTTNDVVVIACRAPRSSGRPRHRPPRPFAADRPPRRRAKIQARPLDNACRYMHTSRREPQIPPSSGPLPDPATGHRGRGRSFISPIYMHMHLVP